MIKAILDYLDGKAPSEAKQVSTGLFFFVYKVPAASQEQVKA